MIDLVRRATGEALLRFFVPLCLCCSVACSGGDLKFADWTIPVAEGNPIFEYRAVSLDARVGKSIGTETDLVLGADMSDPQQVFYRVSGVVPDPEGNIWVNDRGNLRVQVFDPSGDYIRTIGQEGQGPGEFERPIYPVIAAGHFLVRANTRRLSLWALDGQHVRDMQLMKSLSQFTGVEEGFVAHYWTPVEGDGSPTNGPPRETSTYALFDLDAQEEDIYAEVLQPEPELIEISGVGAIFTGAGGFIPSWTMRFAVAPGGRFYLTASDEYQLHSYGSQPWSLRVAWTRDRIEQQHRDNVVTPLKEDFPDINESSLPWVDRFQSIANVEVDGHGHIYVFPFFPPLNAPREPEQEAPEIDRPVDVYSTAGEHLFSGMISISSWTGALVDHVYLSRANRETGEVEVARIRLVEPF